MADINIDDYELYQGMLFPKGTSREDRDRYIQGQQHAESYQQQVAAGGEMPLVDKISRSLGNVPESGYKVLESLGQAIENPIDTANLITKLGAGALQLGAQKLGIPVPEGESFLGSQENVDLAKKMGEFFVNRYGSLEKAQETLIKDPVGAAADASALLMLGGGWTRGAGTITGATEVARAGEMMQRAGQAMDPITGAVKAPIAAAQLAGKGVGELTSGVIGMQTGTGQAPIKEAFAAGVEGGQRGQSFRESMRGGGDMQAIVDDAATAINQMKDRAMSAYQADKKILQGDKTVLSFDAIDDAIAKSGQMAMSGKIVKRPNVKKYVDEAKQAVAEWKAGDPAVNHTAAGFDDLKQRIMDIYENIPMENRTAQTAILEIKKQIQKTIGNQAPGYAKMMADYAKAMDELTEVRKALSQGGKASAETKLKKLQSVMNDNVNTGWGSRREAVAKLDEEGANIVPRIAGQALESMTPRGIQRATTLPTAMGLGYVNPLLGATQAAMSSPRLMGELAHLTGKMARPIDRLSQIAGKPLKAMDQPELMQLLYQMTRGQGDL